MWTKVKKVYDTLFELSGSMGIFSLMFWSWLSLLPFRIMYEIKQTGGLTWEILEGFLWLVQVFVVVLVAILVFYVPVATLLGIIQWAYRKMTTERQR